MLVASQGELDITLYNTNSINAAHSEQNLCCTINNGHIYSYELFIRDVYIPIIILAGECSEDVHGIHPKRFTIRIFGRPEEASHSQNNNT